MLHGSLTIFVVVATANHYWLDGIAACVLLAPAWLIALALERVRVRRVSAEEAEDLTLEPVSVSP